MWIRAPKVDHGRGTGSSSAGNLPQGRAARYSSANSCALSRHRSITFFKPCFSQIEHVREFCRACSLVWVDERNLRTTGGRNVRGGEEQERSTAICTATSARDPFARQRGTLRRGQLQLHDPFLPQQFLSTWSLGSITLAGCCLLHSTSLWGTWIWKLRGLA